MKPGPLFALALGSTALIGPLAVHLFLPVIPAVKSAFGMSEAVAQLTFSIALFTMSFATLIYGSLADRFGRRPVLLSGLVLFLAGSIISAVAPTTVALVLGRFVQAIGAGCGMTLVRTIARDAYGPERIVKALAYLTMFYTMGPMLAPAIGGIVVDTLGWRSVFGLALVLGAAILLNAFVSIYETRPQTGATRSEMGLLRSYVALFSHLRFVAFVLQSGFISGAFMAIASASSMLMSEYLGLPPTQFGFYFMLFPVGFFVGNLMASRVGNRATAEAMVLIGSTVAALAVGVQAALLLSGHVSPLAIFLPGGFLTMGQGLSLAYAQAGAMATIPQRAGTAAGIGVFLQFFGGAVFSQAYGIVANGRPDPMVATATTAAILGFIAGAVPFVLARRARFRRAAGLMRPRQ